MADPPEVVFDRYLRNKIPLEKRKSYRGKLDSALIDHQDTRDLLDETQRSINNAYAAQGARILTHGKPPTLHFDYINATVANAIAFQDEGRQSKLQLEILTRWSFS